MANPADRRGDKKHFFVQSLGGETILKDSNREVPMRYV